MYKAKSQLYSIYLLAVVLFGITWVMPLIYNSFSFAFLFTTALIFVIRDSIKLPWKIIGVSFIWLGTFVIADVFNQGNFDIDIYIRLIPIFLGSITFAPFQEFDKRILVKLGGWFVNGGFFVSNLLLSIAMIDTWKAGSIYIIENTSDIYFNRFFYHNLSDVFGFNAIRLSLLFFLVLVINASVISESRSKWHTHLYTFQFVLIIILLRSSVVLFFVIIFFLYYLYPKLNTILKSVITIFIIGLGCFIIYLKVDPSNLQFEWGQAPMKFGSFSIRYALSLCGVEVFESGNFFIGSGLSNVKSILLSIYESKGFNLALTNQYFCHNQYLFNLVASGILGLLSFLFFLYLYGKEIIKSKKGVLVLFFSLLVFELLWDDFLLIQRGVMFFTTVINITFYISLNHNVRELTLIEVDKVNKDCLDEE